MMIDVRAFFAISTIELRSDTYNAYSRRFEHRPAPSSTAIAFHLREREGLCELSTQPRCAPDRERFDDFLRQRRRYSITTARCNFLRNYFGHRRCLISRDFRRICDSNYFLRVSISANILRRFLATLCYNTLVDNYMALKVQSRKICPSRAADRYRFKIAASLLIAAARRGAKCLAMANDNA